MVLGLRRATSPQASLRPVQAPQAGFWLLFSHSWLLFSPYFSFQGGSLGAPNSGGVSHRADGLSNRHGVRGVRGEEIGQFNRKWTQIYADGAERKGGNKKAQTQLTQSREGAKKKNGS
jgi:hypothetical protein